MALYVCSYVTFYGNETDLTNLKKNISTSNKIKDGYDYALDFNKIIPINDPKDAEKKWGVYSNSIDNKLILDTEKMYVVAFETKNTLPKVVFEELSKKFPDIEINVQASTEDNDYTWDLRYKNGKLEKEESLDINKGKYIWEQWDKSKNYLKKIQDIDSKNNNNTTSCIKVKAKNLKNQKDQKNEIEM